MFLADDGIDLSPYVHAFYEGLLRGALLAWPVWVVLGLLFVGALGLGVLRRLLRAPSGSGNVNRMGKR
jgi:hypothetical protein